MNPTVAPAAASTRTAGPIEVTWREGRRLRTVVVGSPAAACAAMCAAAAAGHRPDSYSVSNLADRPALQAAILAEAAH